MQKSFTARIKYKKLYKGKSMKKTKIICTIGPASENKEVLEQLVGAGMNVARINFSHGTHEEHLKKIKNIKSVRDKLKQPIAIMLDTKGPEYRIKTFKDGKITLKAGDVFRVWKRRHCQSVFCGKVVLKRYGIH